MSVKEKMTVIADKIREFLVTESKYSLDSMPEAICDVFSRGASLGEEVAKSKPYLDTSLLTDFSNFCALGVRQEALPFLDTSNGTTFSRMFNGCYKLTTIPFLDTSNGTTFSCMFDGCSNLITIPALDTSNGTTFSEMFYGCSNLITIPALDTSNGTNFLYMFDGCRNLTTISLLDISNGTTIDGMFDSCISLENITFAGTISQSLDMYYSPLTKESITSIIEHLSSSVSGKTLILKKTAVHNAFTVCAANFESGWNVGNAEDEGTWQACICGMGVGDLVEIGECVYISCADNNIIVRKTDDDYLEGRNEGIWELVACGTDVKDEWGDLVKSKPNWTINLI